MVAGQVRQRGKQKQVAVLPRSVPVRKPRGDIGASLYNSWIERTKLIATWSEFQLQVVLS